MTARTSISERELDWASSGTCNSRKVVAVDLPAMGSHSTLLETVMKVKNSGNKMGDQERS